MKLKITMLFLLILCVFSILIIALKGIYIKNIERENINNIEIALENDNRKVEESKQKEGRVLPDGAVGLLIIPSIGVNAPIREGTNADIIKYTIGHFENTNLWYGNVALASHNEGSYAHYFSRINELKNGEEIIYVTNMGERRYSVYESKIIKETNIDILKNTKENIITLVTCVKGQRHNRLCVIGKEIT